MLHTIVEKPKENLSQYSLLPKHIFLLHKMADVHCFKMVMKKWYYVRYDAYVIYCTK